jgi:hypothetical protein
LRAVRRAHGHRATKRGDQERRSALTNPLSRETLGWKRIPTVVVGAIAILLASLSLVVGFAARDGNRHPAD